MNKNLYSEEGWIQDLRVPDQLGTSTDVTLVCKDPDKKFYAHSVVLSLSPVLRRCLGLVDVRVCKDATINVQFHHSVVAALLSFLYTGYVKVDTDLRDEFFKLCHSLSLNPPITIDEEKTDKETNEEVAVALDKDLSNNKPEVSEVLKSNAPRYTTDGCKKPSNKQIKSDLQPSSVISLLTDESHAQQKEDDCMQPNILSEKELTTSGTSTGLSDSSSTSANKTVEAYLRPTKIELLLAPTSASLKSPSALKKADSPAETASETSSKNINYECDNNTSYDPPTPHTSTKLESSMTSSLLFKTPPCTPSPPTHIVRKDPFKNIRSAGFLSKTPLTSASAVLRTKESASGIRSPFFTSGSKSNLPTSQPTLTPCLPPKIQEPVIPLTCDTCFKIYVGKEALARHKLSEHTEEDKEIGRYVANLIKQKKLEEGSSINNNEEDNFDNDESFGSDNSCNSNDIDGADPSKNENNDDNIEEVKTPDSDHESSNLEDTNFNAGNVPTDPDPPDDQDDCTAADQDDRIVVDQDDRSVGDQVDRTVGDQVDHALAADANSEESSEIHKDSLTKFEDISSEDDELSKDGNAKEKNEGEEKKSEQNDSAEIHSNKAGVNDTKIDASSDKLIHNESKVSDDKKFDAEDVNQVDDGDLEDEETTERISDYLSELNKQIKPKKKYNRRKKSPSTKSSPAPKESKSKKKKEPEIKYEELNTEKSSESAIPSPVEVPSHQPQQDQHDKQQDEFTSEDNFEDSGFKEFKMPENFDFPLDYIQEIVPAMNTSRDSDTASNLEQPDISRLLSPLTVHTPTTTLGHRRLSNEALKVEVISPVIRDSSPLSMVESIQAPIMLSDEASNMAVDLPAAMSSPMRGERGSSPVLRHSTSSPVLRHGTSSPEHITYYVRDNSSRFNKGTRRHALDDTKFNRKKKSYVNELFDDDNSQEEESDELVTVPTEPGTIPVVRKEFETCGGTATILTELGKDLLIGLPDQVAPDSGLMDDLKDKKERIKRKLLDQDSETEQVPAFLKEKRKKKKKRSSDVATSRSLVSPSPSVEKSGSQAASASSSKPIAATKPTSSDKKFGVATSTLKYSKPVESSKAPYKYENDFNWLVNDSYEDSSDSERRRRKEKKRKKRKRRKERQQGSDSDQDEDEEESSDEDERRKRLDARKKRKGGDVLAWMSRRPKVSVRYWDEGKETIIEKYIYKMNLLGADDSSGSSGVDQELRNRQRQTSTSDDSLPTQVSTLIAQPTPSPRKKQKHKKHKKEKSRRKHNSNSGSDSHHHSQRPGSAASGSSNDSRHHHHVGADSGSSRHRNSPKNGGGSGHSSKDSRPHSFSDFMRQLSANDSVTTTPSFSGRHSTTTSANTDDDRKKALKRSLSLADERKSSSNQQQPQSKYQAQQQTQPHSSFQRSMSSSFTTFKIPKLSSSKPSTGD